MSLKRSVINFISVLVLHYTCDEENYININCLRESYETHSKPALPFLFCRFFSETLASRSGLGDAHGGHVLRVPEIMS